MFLVRQLDDKEDRYRFAHKSFQEYFLASAIVEAGEKGAAAIADVFKTKPFTKEIVNFVHEILAGTRGSVDSTFVGNLRRWLVGRARTREQMPSVTADGAANAARLLVQLAQLRGHSEGWIPEKADLREVTLTGEDLRGIRFVGARLDAANVCYAKLDHANLEGASLRGARLHGARFEGTNMRNVDAVGAHFTFVTASKTNLEGARFDEAVLRQSVWVDCCFSGATLKDADVIAWMTFGAEGLAASDNDARKIGFVQVELAVDDLEDSWREVVAGFCHADGTRLTFVTQTGSVVVIDCQTRQRLAYFPNAIPDAGNAKIRCAARADVLVSLDAEGTARVFDLREFRVRRTLSGRFSCIAISSDGALLALATTAGRVSVVAVTLEEDVAMYDSMATQVLDMAFAPGGEALAISYDNGSGLLWRFKRGEHERFHAPKAGAPIRHLVFHPDDDIVAGFSGDCFIRFWDISTKKFLGQILTPEVELAQFSFSPNGTFLAGLSPKGILRTWNVEQRQEISRIEIIQGSRRNAITWTADESQLVSLGTMIEFCDYRNGVPVFTMGTSARRIERRLFNELRWSQESNRLLCVAQSPMGHVMVDFQTGNISSLHNGQDVKLLGCGDDNTLLAIVEGKSIQHLSPEGQPIGVARSLTPVPDHSVLVMQASSDVFYSAISADHLYLWNAHTAEVIAKWSWSRPRPSYAIPNATGEKMGVMVGEELVIMRCGFDQDVGRLPIGAWRQWDWHSSGEGIVFIGEEGVIHAWLPGGEPSATQLSFAAGYCLRSHPKEELFAVGEGNGTISLVDAKTFTVMRTLKEHTAPVWRIEWSPDGSRIATADAGGTVCVWDSSRGKLLLTLTAAGDVALARTPSGFCEFVGGALDDFRLAVVTDPESHARLYVPLGDLREVLHRPDKIAAALQGNLASDSTRSLDSFRS
jgi:WD40 repeat protein/uncharacterized protein YjbI with pentapeptide repeats